MLQIIQPEPLSVIVIVVAVGKREQNAVYKVAAGR